VVGAGAPILGFVFGTKGLMADLSLKGSKLTSLDKFKDKCFEKGLTLFEK
jgi:lipid-binding SYLF domain-containing protein